MRIDKPTPPSDPDEAQAFKDYQSKNLTKKQKALVEAFSAGIPKIKAATIAGYSTSSPQALACIATRTLALPHVQKKLWEKREKILNSGMADVALKTLNDIMIDDQAPQQARITAAKWVLEAAGHGIESKRLLAKIDDDSKKSISELTAADLEQVVLRATERVKIERAALAVDAEIV